MSTHKETLNKHKLNLLKQGAEEVITKGENIVDIGIFRNNINSYNNWQKLRYHGLIAHVVKNGVKQRGLWVITRNGWKFLRNELQLPKYVLINNNEIVERSPETIEAKDLYRLEEIVQTSFEYYEPGYDSYERVYKPVQPAFNLGKV